MPIQIMPAFTQNSPSKRTLWGGDDPEKVGAQRHLRNAVEIRFGETILHGAVVDGFGEAVRRISKDKGLSRLGDSFVNFVYSSAKSRSTGRPFGGKVPDRVLSRSLALSGIGMPPRLNHGERGDIVEGALAYAWSKNLLTLDEAVSTVERKLNMVEFQSQSAEDEASALAFSELFLIAMRRICGTDQGRQ